MIQGDKPSQSEESVARQTLIGGLVCSIALLHRKSTSDRREMELDLNLSDSLPPRHKQANSHAIEV